MKYGQLDLRLLVAGELNIALRGNVSSQERLARLQLLEDVVFDAAYYQWSAVLRFHAAVLSEVEAGALAWGQSYARLEQQMLMPFPISKSRGEKKVDSGESRDRAPYKSRDRAPNRERYYYCGEFQGGACAQNGHHTGLLFGQSVTLHHVCSVCWLNENKKVTGHAASSAECPHNRG